MSTTTTALITFLSFIGVCWWSGSAIIRLLPLTLVAPRFFLALPVGVITVLTFFSALAHFIPSYAVALPLSILIPRGIAAFFTRAPSPAGEARAASAACIVVWVTITLTCWLLHAYWPALHWENSVDKAGVEKLFNLSVQQSFLFGDTYPPEWIWLAGEKVRYYALPKALPGITSWLSRIVFLNPVTGGVHFILSEGFYIGLAASSCTAWIITLLGVVAPGGSHRAKLVLGVSVGVLWFLGVHWYGALLGLSHVLRGSAVSWWDFQEQVVPFTQNQYPIWLLILGDNHAYLQILPFQITLWGLSILLLLQRGCAPGVGVLTGICAASVYLSHAPSVLINMCTLVPSAIVILSLESVRRNWERIAIVAVNGAVTTATSLLFIVVNAALTGETKWVIPGAEIASPVLGFLSVQFWPLLWFVACIASGAIAVGWSTQAYRRTWELPTSTLVRHSLEWWIVGILLGAVWAWYADRPALFIAIACASVVGFFAAAAESELLPFQRRAIAILSMCAFGIWVFPEVFAIDHTADSRTAWIRFNIVLRFWPEGYLLLPFITTIALGGGVVRAFSTARGSIIWSTIAALFASVLALSHVPALKDRINTAQGPAPSLDGFQFLAKEAPYDQSIVEYLAYLPATPQVVIAEACGTRRYPAVPMDYAWPGRISAFSGRVGVCGWSRHAELHQSSLKVPFRDSARTLDRVKRYEDAVLRIFVEGGATLPGWTKEHTQEFTQALPVGEALRVLSDLGVTHLILGEQERKAYGAGSIERLAEVVGGKIVLKVGASDEFGIVELR